MRHTSRWERPVHTANELSLGPRERTGPVDKASSTGNRCHGCAAAPNGAWRRTTDAKRRRNTGFLCAATTQGCHSDEEHPHPRLDAPPGRKARLAPGVAAELPHRLGDRRPVIAAGRRHDPHRPYRSRQQPAEGPLAFSNPECWSCSSLSVRGPSTPNVPPSTRTTGVFRTSPPIRSAARPTPTRSTPPSPISPSGGRPV